MSKELALTKEKSISELQHEFIDVEEAFIELMPKVNGYRVTDYLKVKDPKFKNADFYFHSENIICELKTLSKSLNERKLKSKFENAMKENDINLMHKIIEKPLKKVILNANRQIKTTAKELNISNSKGTLLLCNDKLLDVPNDVIVAICNKILSGPHYSCIDAFVYFTLNIYSSVPSNEYANLLWSPTYKNEYSHLPKFIDRLGRSWFDYLENKIGPFEHRHETKDYDDVIGSMYIQSNKK